MVFVSVIVPVYNVEKYLDRCVQSILDQSYSDFEVLLIDDGSRDASGSLCDLWSRTDSRIKTYHKENGGLSDARNYGIDHAKGAYITFIDSDDYIGRDYLKILVDLVTEYRTQIACVSSLTILENMTGTCGGADDRGHISTEEALKYMCTRKYFGVAAYGKLYKAELFENIRYPKGRIYEDLLTVPYLIDLSDSVSYSSSKQYCWVQRAGSITHVCHSEKEMRLHLEGLKKLIDFIDGNHTAIHDAAICRYVDDSFAYTIHNLVYGGEYSERIGNIIACSRRYWREGLRNRYIGKFRKMEIILMTISPWLYRIVYLSWVRIKRLLGTLWVKH